MKYSLRTSDIPLVVDTSHHNLVENLFQPALRAAVKYDRGVGFFSAGWLRINAKGMSTFASNGGQARWITSPILSDGDWHSLLEGVQARSDNALKLAMQKNIAELEEQLARDTLSTLAWLVADNILDFKLALPRDKLSGGEFHAKFGIFTDEAGDQVCFNGSYNDSIQGTLNYETIHVFHGWETPTAGYVTSFESRFDRLWNNKDSNVQVFDLPEAARAQILKLRTYDRPYLFTAKVGDPLSIQNLAATPQVPASVKIRDYQEEAIAAWFEHDCQGLLEMATGTGKTITSLAASVKLFEREERLAVVVTVPYQHLVDQWNEEASAFGYNAVLAYKSKERWLNELNHQILDYNAGHRPFMAVITTHTTFTSPDFQRTIARITGPSLILADEAHHLGAEQSRAAYPHHIPFRLALSATPDRWFDDVGTTALRNYFGKTVFAFPLEKAIGVSLTAYYYYPHTVTLSDEEMEAYEALSTKIAQLMGRQDDKGQEILRQLLIKRANLLKRAENKIDVLATLIDEQKYIEHTLFYCAPGQINDVMQLVGWEKGILAHRFTAEESTGERQQLLGDFASSQLQALVAMKCLDEGVDVPSTHMAFFLASSSNPREFVQRRGRVLRKSPGKDFSVIHDLITVPPHSRDASISNAERSIVKRELERFKEFANLAENKNAAIDVIWDIAKRYNLMDF